MRKYRVSTVCPSCGQTAFKKTRPKAAVAFASDRICKACGTRYTPPTPRWAAAVFVLVGLPLAALGLLDLFRGPSDKFALFELLFSLALVVAGILAIVHGVRSVIKGGMR